MSNTTNKTNWQTLINDEFIKAFESELVKYKSIHQLRSTNEVAYCVYDRLLDLYTKRGKIQQLLREEYDPTKGTPPLQFLCCYFKREFKTKSKKAMGDAAKRKHQEVSLDFAEQEDGGKKLRGEVHRTISENAQQPNTVWVREVIKNLPSNSHASMIAEILLLGVEEAYAARGKTYPQKSKHGDFTLAGELLGLTKKQIERAKKALLGALAKKPESGGIIRRAEKIKEKRSEKRRMRAEAGR